MKKETAIKYFFWIIEISVTTSVIHQNKSIKQTE